jgi:hypothetical protein
MERVLEERAREPVGVEAAARAVKGEAVAKVVAKVAVRVEAVARGAV